MKATNNYSVIKFNAKIIVIFLLFLGIDLSAQMQNCGEEEIISIQKKTVKNYDAVIKQNNLAIKNYIDNYLDNSSDQSKTTAAASYTIPVVFHIIHPVGEAYGTGVNISYQQIISQLNALNAAFSKNYPAYNGQTHPVYAQNTNIQFCLAGNTAPSSLSFYNGPSGTERGVMRYSDNTITNHQMSTASANAMLGLTHPTGAHFPFTNYLNIWVVSSIAGSSSGTVMGYAPKPIMSSYPLDGVVMRSDIIGDNSISSNNFLLNFGLQQGKVLAHEIGHYLNLFHIFEGGCFGLNASTASSDQCDLNGDMICDIEPCTTQNISCTSPIPNTCNATYSSGTTIKDMIEDYMSYADDDCMNTFTQGQKLRMQATLNTLRANLWQTANLAATGVIGPGGCSSAILYSTIMKNSGNNCINTPISLYNSTTGNTASSWSWTLTGGSPSTATTNSISVTYTAPGLYWAKLSVSNGTLAIKDSMALGITTCTLDPTKLNRSNWLFGDSCSVSFSSGTAVPNNLVKQKKTIQCVEVSVSMSDSLGNLLFYSDGVSLWDNLHNKINTTPLFGWTNVWLPKYYGTSVHGFISFPIPKQPNKYAIICTPPGEIRYPSQGPYSALAKISCVIYDANTKTVTPFQSYTSSLVNGTSNNELGEDLCIVPHCNGIDFWVICRARINAGNNDAYYSFLFNQNGFNPNAVPVTSGPFKVRGFSGVKSNSVGNRLVCSTCSTPIGNFVLYDFDQTTGVVSNEISIPLPTVPTRTALACGSSIFSPNDAYVFLNYIGPTSMGNFIQQVSVNTLSVVNTFSNSYPATPMLGGYMEIGPDNDLYYNTLSSYYLGRISNPNTPSITAQTTPVSFMPFTNCLAGISLVNYVEAKKTPEIDPFLYQYLNCTSFSFSVDPCWSIYNASWNYGDGSPIASGTNVVHTYTTGGIYTVSLTLSYNSQSIPVYTKTINVITPASAAISGPTLICKGSSFLNNYSTTNISGATYSWTANNSTIIGFNTLSNVNLGGIGTGTAIATVSVQISNGGCNAVATKTILVDSVPNVQITNTTSILCVGDSLLLTGNPTGGVFTGAHVSGNKFKSLSTGSFVTYYTYSNSNGCVNTGTLGLTVNACVGIHENDKDDFVKIYPNPTDGYLNINSYETIEKIEVYNYIGQMMIYNSEVHSKSIKLDLRSLPQALYFIKIFKKEDFVIFKLIKD